MHTVTHIHTLALLGSNQLHTQKDLSKLGALDSSPALLLACSQKETMASITTICPVQAASVGVAHEHVTKGRTKSGYLSIRASTCIEEAIVQTEPLTKKDLVNSIASACKPKGKWRIGTECEKFGFERATSKPISYDQIVRLLEGLAGRYDWDRIVGNGFLLGLRKAGKSITMEAGGQIELSGAPLMTLHETFAELNSYFAEVNDVAGELGIGFLGCGFQPKWPFHVNPMMPMEKVGILRDCYDINFTTGTSVIVQTCSVQVNLDFSSEEDMINKYRVGLALQPVATALFANSPFTEGKPNGFLSYRSERYKGLGNERSGMVPFVFEDDFGFERFVEYALDVPMFYAYRHGHYVKCCGDSFRDFIAGRLPSLPGERATLRDWDNHLMQIFPEVRLKKILEMRGADVGPWRHLCALPAFWVGLLYDEKSLKSALELIQDWTSQERQMLRNTVPRLGLRTPFRGSLLKHVAQDVVKLAKEGLQRRGFNEVHFLEQTEEIAKTGVTPAEKLLELYNGRWNKSVDPIFEELLYGQIGNASLN